MSDGGGPGEAASSIEGLRAGFEETGRLRGFRSACGFVTAIWGLRCPQCGDRLEPASLASTGRILSFTVQTVPSDEFLNDAPYAYVVVELDGGGRVTGWMPGVRGDDEIALGARVRARSSYKPGVQFEPAGDDGGRGA